MQVKRLFYGVHGSFKLYEYAVRFSYMLTEKAKFKYKVLVFWEKHGLQATLDAFPVKRSTLFLWKKQFNEGGRRVESLNEKSRAPINRRKRVWPSEIEQEIKRLRKEHPNLGKDKIYPELKEFCDKRHLPCPCESTIGRIIKDKGGLRVFPQKISHFGKIKLRQRKKKLRKPKGFKITHAGHFVELDTVERRVGSLKRYIITFIDIHTRFTFAWAYKTASSSSATDFFNKILKVFPYPIEHLQTDNGSEFAKHFADKIKGLCLTHFHIYPRTPQHNSHIERYNRTIQEEFVDYHEFELKELKRFNHSLIDYLLWYNTRRIHCSLNKQSPLQFIFNQDPQKSKMGWTCTLTC